MHTLLQKFGWMAIVILKKYSYITWLLAAHMLLRCNDHGPLHVVALVCCLHKQLMFSYHNLPIPVYPAPSVNLVCLHAYMWRYACVSCIVHITWHTRVLLLYCVPHLCHMYVVCVPYHVAKVTLSFRTQSSISFCVIVIVGNVNIPHSLRCCINYSLSPASLAC